MPGEDRVDRLTIADVGLFKGIVRAVGALGHIRKRAGVGQLVEVDDLVAVADGMADDRRTDEASAAGDEEFHCCAS